VMKIISVRAVAIANIVISRDRAPRRSITVRRFSQNMRMTSDHPRPIKRRFDPVTLAATRPISSVTSLVSRLNEPPASQASTASIAYSGRMATSASTAMAREAETSTCAASAPRTEGMPLPRCQGRRSALPAPGPGVSPTDAETRQEARRRRTQGPMTSSGATEPVRPKSSLLPIGSWAWAWGRGG